VSIEFDVAQIALTDVRAFACFYWGFFSEMDLGAACRSQAVYPLSRSNDLNSFRHDSVLGRDQEVTNTRQLNPNSNVMSRGGKTFQKSLNRRKISEFCSACDSHRRNPQGS